jgi:hypothetical protein
VHLVADEPGGGLRGLTGVDAHAHPQLLPVGPFVAGKGTLHLDSGGHTGARGVEEREERVALGPLLLTGVGFEARADEPVVVFEDLRVDVVAEAVQECRRSLDIGEQERQRVDGRSVGDAPPGCTGWIGPPASRLSRKWRLSADPFSSATMRQAGTACLTE